MSPSAIDLQTLQELPLEVQQEVAAAMTHARKFPTTRPGFQSMRAEPAEPPAAAVPPTLDQDALEDVKLLWPRIAEALHSIEDLAEEVSGRLTGALPLRPSLGHAAFKHTRRTRYIW